MGDDDMARWRASGQASRGGGRGRRKRSLQARVAYFSSQAATRKASDDGQKAQPAAFHPQTSLTNAGDRRDEKRRGEKDALNLDHLSLCAQQPSFPWASSLHPAMASPGSIHPIPFRASTSTCPFAPVDPSRPKKVPRARHTAAPPLTYLCLLPA